MKRYTLPGQGKHFSQVLIGCDRMGLDNYAEAASVLDTAMEMGFNAFDLAWVYVGGNAERALGKWMKERGNREEVFILTKGAHHNADRKKVTPFDITSDLHDSLARLQTSYIDLYLLHRDDPSQEVGPIIEILNEHQRAGKINAFGGSNWTHQRIAEANEYARAQGLNPMAASSPNYSLCDQVEDPWGEGCVSIGGEAGREARAFYQAQDIPVFAYSSLGRGLFSGRVNRDNYKETLDGPALKAYAHEQNFKKLDRCQEKAAERGVKIPQIALAYLLNQPFKVFPLVGAFSRQELEETAQAAGISLADHERIWLESGN
ncbi:MAG: aldo/keto reductase [Treponema sp.]|nr:aldo/keto reductase [Treponema sp.]